MSEGSKPRAAAASVTLVVISYNHEKYLEQALDSAFAQTYSNCSVLIFDDASTDGSAQCIRDYLARTGHPGKFIHHEQNRGLCATLNEALGLLTSDYVAFISADDWMETNRVEVQVAALESLGPEYGAAYSDATLVDLSGQPLGGTFLGDYLDEQEPPQGDIFLDLLARSWIPAPSVLIRVADFFSVGPYDQNLPFEDYDMWLRISRSFKITFTSGCLVNYRIVPGSLSDVVYGDRASAEVAKVRMFKKHLGVTQAADSIIFDKLEHLAISQYLRGAGDGKVRSDLRLVARRTGRPVPMMYAAFATMGIPGPWIGRVRERVKRVRQGA